MKHRDVFFRCTRPGTAPVVAGVKVRDGIVTETAPYLRRHVGLTWRSLRIMLENDGWRIEETEDAEP